MKKLLIALLFFTPSLFAQTTVNGRVSTGPSNRLPAICNVADQFNATDTGNIYVCGPTANTWTIKPGGNPGPPGPPGEGISAWSATVPPGGYDIGAVVSYMGSLYVSIAGSNLNHLPTDVMYWSASPTLGGVSGDVQTNNGSGQLAGGTQLSVLSHKSATADKEQWVSPAGNDSNDGLSIGTAKLTWDAACEALTGGSASPATCGSGRIHVSQTVAASAAGAQYGILMAGPGDPNYASPPTGWVRIPANTFIVTDCITGNLFGNNGHKGLCTITGGSSTNRDLPGIWFAGVNQYEFDGIALRTSVGGLVCVPMKIGIASDNTRTTAAGVAGISFFGGDYIPAQTLGCGPGMDFGGNTFWVNATDITSEGNTAENLYITSGTGLSRLSNVVTAITNGTNDNYVGQTVLVKNATTASFNGVFTVTGVSGSPQTHVTWAQVGPDVASGGGSGTTEFYNCRSFSVCLSPAAGQNTGLITFERTNMNAGSVMSDRLTSSLVAFNLIHNTEESNGNDPALTPPAVLITNSASTEGPFIIYDLTVADTTTPTCAVQVENTGLGIPDAVSVDGISGIVCGPRTEKGASSIAANVNGSNLTAQGGTGFVRGFMYGQTDASARQFSPVSVRYANIATYYDPSTWNIFDFSGTGTVTTGKAAPDGTSNAAEVASSGSSLARFWIDSGSHAQGNYIAFTAWLRSTTSNGFDDYGLSGLDCTTTSITNPKQGIIGQSDWVRIWGICKLSVADSGGTYQFYIHVDSTHTAQVYAPTIVEIPAAAGDNDAWQTAINLQTYSTACVVGHLCGPTVVSDITYVQLLAFDFATDVAVADGVYYFVVPPSLDGKRLVSVSAQDISVGVMGTTDVQLARCALVATGGGCTGTVVDILSTVLTIDSGENKSSTAAVPPVINTSNNLLATDQLIRVDVDAVSSMTAPKGLIVTIGVQ